MRDDDRRPRFDDEDNLFSELRAELDAVDQPPETAAASLGPKLPPPAPERSQPGSPAASAYPPEGFDSDEELGRLPSFPAAGDRPRRAPVRAPGRRPSRIILGAVCLAVVATVFLFWRPGGKSEPPLGVGERTSTLTRDGTSAAPITGTVDIAAETQPLVAEQGAAGAEVGTPALKTPTMKTPTVGSPVRPQLKIRAPQSAPLTSVVKPAIPAGVGTRAAAAGTDAAARPHGSTSSGPARATGSEPPTGFAVDAEAGAPAPESPTNAAEPVAAPVAAAAAGGPAATGPWALQLGAFSTQDNADALAGKLRAQGLHPFVQTGSSSHGGLIFKVAIGYFATRDEAAAYARKNAAILGGQALPVHR